MLLAVVIVTGWVTTVYSNFKEEDIMSSREPASVLVLADVESSAAHTRVTDQILAYLRAVGGVDKVYYVRDARDGPRPGESVESWWRRALRDQKVIKDGSVIFFPGPPSSPQAAGRDLVTAQMALLCQDPGDAAAAPQLTLAAAVAQRRVIVVKLPYSDLGNLPPLQQLPLKVRMVSSVAVPLETRQLIRRIQRADQLTVAINLQVGAALVLVILSFSNIIFVFRKTCKTRRWVEIFWSQ